MSEVEIKEKTTMIKEEEPSHPPVSRDVAGRMVVLTMQNLAESLRDLAGAVPMIVGQTKPEDVIRKIGASRVAVEMASRRLDDLLKSLINKDSLTP